MNFSFVLIFDDGNLINTRYYPFSSLSYFNPSKNNYCLIKLDYMLVIQGLNIHFFLVYLEPTIEDLLVDTENNKKNEQIKT